MPVIADSFITSPSCPVSFAPCTVGVAVAFDNQTVETEVHSLLAKRCDEFALTTDVAGIADDRQVRDATTQIQRDYAYHQGTAWPWLMGFYMEAYLRIYKMSGLSFIERQLIGLEDELTIHCISSLPELFDGNPPFKGRGAVSFAMNVAEVLRILKLLSKYY